MHSTIFDSPFKDSTTPFNCAVIQTVAFDKLVRRDATELARLLAACEQEGFFYLDLTSPESKSLYDDYKSVLSVMKEWFNESPEEKAKFAYGSDIHGYVSIPNVPWIQQAEKVI